MSSEKCPRCGAEMKHVAINYLGCTDNGHRYECPECEYQDYLTQTRPKRTYGGEIIGLRSTDNGETVLHIKLDDPEERIRHCRVCIIEGEPA